MASPGSVLTQEEVLEIQAYGNAGLALPDKYATVVIDATQPSGAVYRWASTEAIKAQEEIAKTSEAAVEADKKRVEKVKADASKAAAVPPPDKPAEKP